MDQKQSIQEGVKNNHNLTVNNQVALKKCSSDIKTLISNSLISNSDFKTQRNKASILWKQRVITTPKTCQTLTKHWKVIYPVIENIKYNQILCSSMKTKNDFYASQNDIF